MNYFKALLFFFTVLILNACDPCKDSACLNGGTCEKGICECPAGYSGESCETYDACHDVTCMNGGTCVSGNCDCPPDYVGVNCETYDPCANVTCYNGGSCSTITGNCTCLSGYSGADCSIELTPVSMSIYQIDGVRYPMTNSNGQDWDATSNPDVFLTFSQGTAPNENHNLTGKFESNMNGGLFSAPLNPARLINNLSTDWTVAAYDYDNPGPSELMGQITFEPMSKSPGLPTSFTVSTATLEIKFHITWNF